MKATSTRAAIALLFCTALLLDCSPTATSSVTVPALPTQQPSAFKQACVRVVPSIEAAPNGIAVIQDEITRNVALLDMETGQQKVLQGEMSFIMAVSPDFRQLALTPLLGGPLTILSPNGEHVATIPIPKDWAGAIQWLNMDTLLLESFTIPYRSASPVVYHLSTGVQQYLITDYPGKSSDPGPQWGNFAYTHAVYDPSLSRVVYAGRDEQGYSVLVLFDMESNKQIIMFHWRDNNPALDSAPQWSHDGASFIAGIPPQYQIQGALHKNVPQELPYKGGIDLFRVSRDGDVKRLTYLAVNHDAGEEAFSLSPDERYVAFWLVLSYGSGPISKTTKSLALLDTETGQITDLCIAGGESSIVPIWSPDGNYLLISRYGAGGTVDQNLLPDVLLLDLRHVEAARIAQKAIARAWMAK